MRSLRMKMVMIMVILILALMLTTGAFLMSGVGNFYVSQFYEQMEETFTPEFIVQLQRLSEEDNDPAQMKALLMAQAGLGIDITGRNVYILDQTGSVLDSSNQKTSVAMTQNILSAMNGEVGQSSAITNNYMDLAVPVDAASGSYIAYIRDNRATVDALTSELLRACDLRDFVVPALADPHHAHPRADHRNQARRRGRLYRPRHGRQPRRDRRSDPELQPHGQGPAGYHR